MRDGEKFPADQAEVVFAEEVVDWIADNLEQSEWDDVIDDIISLFTNPAGKHTLSNRRSGKLAGLNTTATLRGDYRIVFRSSISSEGTGLIQILALGPRSENRIYDAVSALVNSGKLTDDEVESIWAMLAVYDRTAQKHGLELWDYRPPPAPEGMIKAAVVSGVLPHDVAVHLTKDEISAAMADGWNPDTGEPDPDRALVAALERVASSSTPERLVAQRSEPRCGAPMPIAKRPCIRVRGHAGAHRATP